MSEQPTPTELCSIIGCPNEGNRRELSNGAWTIICKVHYQQLYGEGAIIFSYSQGNDQAQRPQPTRHVPPHHHDEPRRFYNSHGAEGGTFDGTPLPDFCQVCFDAGREQGVADATAARSG